jgi:hypothetical protein
LFKISFLAAAPNILQPRDYSEIMETWHTSCPRLSFWEDACIDGLIDHEPGTGKVILSVAGREFLSRSGLTAQVAAD